MNTLQIGIGFLLVTIGLVLAEVARLYVRRFPVKGQKEFWWKIFPTPNARDKRSEFLEVPCDDAELSGQFAGDSQLKLELRKCMPEIPHVYKDNTIIVWNKILTGKFRIKQLTSGNYVLIATSPKSPLPHAVVNNAVRALRNLGVRLWRVNELVQVEVGNSSMDLITLLEQDFQALKKNGSSLDLLNHLQDHHKKFRIGLNVDEWIKFFPGLFDELAKVIKDVPDSPSVIGTLRYQVSCVKRLPEWVFTVGLFLVSIGIAVLITSAR